MKPTLSVYEYEKLIQEASFNSYQNMNIDDVEYVPSYDNLQYCKYDPIFNLSLVTKYINKNSNFNTIKTIHSMYIEDNKIRVRCTLRNETELLELQSKIKSNMESKEKLKYFEYKHLPDHLRPISKAVHDLASEMIEKLPDNKELEYGLRKLLEAKDCFVRAKLG